MIPKPNNDGIPFNLFRALHSNRCGSLPKKIERKMERRLSVEEIAQIDFHDESDALTALIRGIGLENTLRKLVHPNPTTEREMKDAEIYSYCQPKSYLLTSRAGLYLAALYCHQAVSTSPPSKKKKKKKLEAEAQRRKNACSFRDDILQRMGSGTIDLSSLTCYCMKMAADHPDEPLVKAVACAAMARMEIVQVARDKTPVGPQHNRPYAYAYNTTRPAMAEAWLVAAEGALVQLEIDSCLRGDQVSGTRPSCLNGPWMMEDDEEGDDDDAEGPIHWKISTPVLNAGSFEEYSNIRFTYLGPHWWGQTAMVATGLVSGLLTEANNHIARYRALLGAGNNVELRKKLHNHELAFDKELNRRAAAIVANMDMATKDPKTTPKYNVYRQFVDELRRCYAGTDFEPTEDFVRSLSNGEENEERTEWHLGSLHGGMGGGPNRTLLKIIDCEGDYQDYVIGHKLVEDEQNPNSLYVPSADIMYQTLLKCMAGSGKEERAHVGIPRRPRVLVLSYRLRKAYRELKELLQRVGVDCVLDAKENLQFACANNQTDFETGQPLNDDGKSFVSTLIGQIVGLHGLKSRQDLNGRIGRVLKWHEDQQRWEIELIAVLDSERPATSTGRKGQPKNTLALKPENLMSCDQDGFVDRLEDYLEYKGMLRSWNPSQENKESLGPILEEIQGLVLGEKVQEGDLCVICQQPVRATIGNKEDAGLQGVNEQLLGKAVQLPCHHFFHLTCLMKWISPEKAECPCCRKSIGE